MHCICYNINIITEEYTMNLDSLTLNKSNNIVLMLKDIPVLKFNLDNGFCEVHNKNLLPYTLRDVFTFVDKPMPAYELSKIQFKNMQYITSYLARRTLNLDRENAKKLLNAFHLSQSQDNDTKVEIAIVCRGVSMIDDYWLNNENLSIKWADVNLRENHLSEIVAHIALFGKSFTITGTPHTPELTGQGAYAKAWLRKDNGIYLYKKGTKDGLESEIEVSVSNILDCFDVFAAARS